MQPLKRLLSGLILIFLVMTISGMIAARAVNSLFGNSTSDQGSKASAAMSDMMNEAIAMAVSTAMSDGTFGWSLPEAEVQAAVRASLRDQEMTALSTQMSAAFKILRTGAEIEPGEGVLELAAVRDSALGGVRDLVLKQMSGLPICTSGQAAAMVANPPQEMPQCRSSDPAINQALVDQAFEAARAAIPNQVDLGQIIADMNAEMKEQVGGPIGSEMDMPSWATSIPDLGPIVGVPLQITTFLAGWGYLALFGLILALVLINLDTWHAQFGRVGWAALFGAGIPLLISILAIKYLPVALSQVQAAGGSLGSMGSVAYGLLMIPLLEVRTISLIITLLGAGGLIVSVVGRMKTKPTQPLNRGA